MSAQAACRPLRAGIVGGGQGAFIGAVHRIAVELDGEARIVAGAMSSDPARARASAEAWQLERSYDDWREMAKAEAARDDGIDFVIVVTPNHLHAPVAIAFLEAGIPVACDKPLAANVADARAILRAVETSRLPFLLTQTYTGYPMIEQARELVAAGRLGTLRRVQVEYNQDWLKDPIEADGQKQASWRTDPERAGIGGCIGDIGTHAQNLLEYVCGSELAEVCAELSTFVEGRRLDDDASVLLRLANGARGTLSCSQIACREENALTLRLYCTEAGLEWHQQEPNTLLLKPAGRPWERWRSGGAYTGEAALRGMRTPAGHPEGYLEAFANLYRRFVADLRRRHAGAAPQGDYPGAAAGVRSLRFVEGAVDSSRTGGWVTL